MADRERAHQEALQRAREEGIVDDRGNVQLETFAGEVSPFTGLPYTGGSYTPGAEHKEHGWTHEKHVQAGLKGAAHLTPEQRSERARHGVETKRERGNLGSGGDAVQGDFAPPRGHESKNVIPHTDEEEA
mmetsp:Transcript_9684/g.16800  ORF Transcript_9684/g.16800 Transcript_9684/m.16800 type:complete len:130 (-) Transcript_9684:244-633(-)|eukprot:CAMPEP_0196658188 /NCGR_PEP_ID=MMETSP1086-20130531/27891_1 /TAXON_ID=77921 /ORGANISM="Cyanoptyche  gloeocystis , Strain SAG4.97" /LENGTH=129 /DNA_ID=CAMNT_0041991645 /DNA_START=133 /DNA_END=522 /DNA_ORIENTATION=+